MPTPGVEDLTGDSAGAANLAGSGAVGLGGALGGSGAPARAGSSSSGGSSNASGGKGGSTSTGGKGGAPGGAGASTAGTAGTGTVGTAGAGTGPNGCTHPQPGEDGLTVQTKLEGATDSIYFSAQIDNPDDRAANVSDIKLRYYLVTSDMGDLSSDFYLKQIKTASVTKEIDGAPTVTYQDGYFEISFPGSTATFGKGESFVLKVHTHNSMYKTHDQTQDYSYNASTALVPWCKVVLYDRGPLAWGTAP